jgi:hypothetical protein
MTPKEKADELIVRFGYVENIDDIIVRHGNKRAVMCALICVDELIEALEHNSWQNKDWINHYKEVKQEIEEL